MKSRNCISPDFEFLDFIFMNHTYNYCRVMNELEKEDLRLRALRFKQIHQSSRKIKEDDPITGLGNILYSEDFS